MSGNERMEAWHTRLEPEVNEHRMRGNERFFPVIFSLVPPAVSPAPSRTEPACVRIAP